MNDEKELIKILEQVGHKLDSTKQEKAEQKALAKLQKNKLEKELSKVKNEK